MIKDLYTIEYNGNYYACIILGTNLGYLIIQVQLKPPTKNWDLWNLKQKQVVSNQEK